MGTKEYVVCSFNVLVIWIIGYRFLGIVIVSLYIMDDKTDWWAVVALDTFSISYKYSCVPYSNSHYMFSYSLFRKHELELISFSCTYISIVSLRHIAWLIIYFSYLFTVSEWIEELYKRKILLTSEKVYESIIWLIFSSL